MAIDQYPMAIDQTSQSPSYQMHAEAGFEEDSAPPLRVSGFVSLLLGLLSFLSLIGQPLLVVPLLAFVCGFFALRRTSGQTPLGTRPAMFGMVLAAGFGACGLFMPWMKSVTLGNQAREFSRHYLEVVALGHDEMAMELRRDYVNRLSPSMPLKEHYRLDEDARQALLEFQQDSVNTLIRRRGPGAEWVLYQPIQIVHSYNRDNAEVVWMDPTGETNSRVQFFLEYVVDSSGDGQWYVKVVRPYAERIVAPQVL